MYRYVTYSTLLHAAAVAAFALSSLFNVAAKHYYTVDFMGSAGGGAVGGSQDHMKVAENQAQPKVKETQPAKTKVVDPKEDLLIKSKKKDKKEKEVVATLPIPSAPPIPTLKEIPKRAEAGSGSSSIPGVQSGVGAASGSGIGIGFGDGGGGSGGWNFPYTWYVHSIKKKLDANWNVTSGFSNRIFAQVAFTISRDGTLKNVEIEESSRDTVFDQAARRAVEYSNPFPPLPGDYEEAELRVHVRFTVKR